MADLKSRLESNRALYMRGSRQQLVELIKKYNPNIIAGGIVRTLELLIITEKIAGEHGIEIDDAMIAKFAQQNGEQLDKEVNRALLFFISSIVSQEG